jgi:hypothetical protein
MLTEKYSVIVVQGFYSHSNISPTGMRQAYARSCSRLVLCGLLYNGGGGCNTTRPRVELVDILRKAPKSGIISSVWWFVLSFFFFFANGVYRGWTQRERERESYYAKDPARTRKYVSFRREPTYSQLPEERRSELKVMQIHHARGLG